VKQGRPRTPEQIRELIILLACENDWGYTRILGELRKLGIQSVSRNTMRNILKENGLEPGPKRGAGTWDEFLKIHAASLWQ
jgi:putative transposase